MVTLWCEEHGHGFDFHFNPKVSFHSPDSIGKMCTVGGDFVVLHGSNKLISTPVISCN